MILFLEFSILKCVVSDLTDLFQTSHDYDKLLAAWKGWRDVTGPRMKQNYTDYVRLKNEALKIAGESFLL